MKKLVFIFLLTIPLLTVVEARADKGGVANKNAVAEVEAELLCDYCVKIHSTKDLSNVVILYCYNGVPKVEKFEDLEGFEGTFCVDGIIQRVWVKSGNNKSGDGPGYGVLIEF